MFLSRFALASLLLGVTLACSGMAGPPKAEREAIERLAKEREAKEKAALQKAKADAARAEGARPEWANDTALAAAIGARHYLPALTAGTPYTVPHDGADVVIGMPEVVLNADGSPRVYPTSATQGHVVAKADHEGVAWLIDYTVRWDADAATASGEKGLFQVVTHEVLKAGEAPERFTYTASGDRFTRTTVP